MNKNQCERFLYLCHNEYEKAESVACTCEPGRGCNYKPKGDCPNGCGWVNTWSDSGDRGHAQWYHENHECRKV